VAELDLGLEVEYVTDVQKIIEMGVMQTPVLAIDDKPVLTGFVPGKEKVEELIKKNMEI